MYYINKYIIFSEKFNGKLERMLLKAMNENKDDWDIHIIEPLFAYNTLIQTTTKCSPFYLMYDRLVCPF